MPDLETLFSPLRDESTVPPEPMALLQRRAHRLRRRRRAVRGALLLGMAGLLVGLASIASRGRIVRVDVAGRGRTTSNTTTPHGTVGSDPGDDNTRLSGKVVVGAGASDGVHWRLVAYQSKSGLCADLEIGRLSSGGCGYPAPLGFSQGSGSGVAPSVHGTVDKRATDVRLQVGGRVLVDVKPINGKDFGVNFFVIFLPSTQQLDGLTLVAVNRAGAEIGRGALAPTRDATKGQPDLIVQSAAGGVQAQAGSSCWQTKSAGVCRDAPMPGPGTPKLHVRRGEKIILWFKSSNAPQSIDASEYPGNRPVPVMLGQRSLLDATFTTGTHDIIVRARFGQGTAGWYIRLIVA